MENNIQNNIKKSLEKIRPSLQMDGGDVQFIDFDAKTGVVQVALMGHCIGCPMAGFTLKGGIEAQLMADVPEVKEVVSV